MLKTVNIKTIIVDLDRTLLHTDKTLSAYTIKVLNECKKYGIKIMVATARPFRTTKQYCDLVGIANDADGVARFIEYQILKNSSNFNFMDYYNCQT